MSKVYIGGVEGGATKSRAVIYNGHGEELVTLDGLDTNHWSLGMAETQRRLAQLIADAKEQAGLDPCQPLLSLGLTLSGCEQAESNEILRQGLLAGYPECSKNVFVGSDTLGALAVAHDKGGLVLIAGTGSNALLVNPDGSQTYWIARKAIKVYFDDQDNRKKAPYNTDLVWTIISEHFNVKDRHGLLDHCYTKFDKSFFASMTSKCAAGARNGDALCIWLFQQAGRVLAASVLALWPRIDEKLLKREGGVPVICVGSVWKSWPLMAHGFCQRLKPQPETCLATVYTGNTTVEELSLLRLTKGGETGAAYLAAKLVDYPLPRNYVNNYQVFFHYRRLDQPWKNDQYYDTINN